jgi:hypothetical protein
MPALLHLAPAVSAGAGGLDREPKKQRRREGGGASSGGVAGDPAARGELGAGALLPLSDFLCTVLDSLALDLTVSAPAAAAARRLLEADVAPRLAARLAATAGGGGGGGPLLLLLLRLYASIVRWVGGAGFPRPPPKSCPQAHTPTTTAGPLGCLSDDVPLPNPHHPGSTPRAAH